MDIAYKNDVWHKIGEEIKTDVSVCKAIWNNVRDTYRKSRKTCLTCGQSAKKIKIYEYADELIFLKKYFDERETTTNINREGEENGPRDLYQEKLVVEEDSPSPSASKICPQFPVQGKEKPSFQVRTRSKRRKQSAKSF